MSLRSTKLPRRDLENKMDKNEKVDKKVYIKTRWKKKRQSMSSIYLYAWTHHVLWPNHMIKIGKLNITPSGSL